MKLDRKDAINAAFKGISSFFNGLIESTVSVFRVLLLSSFRIAYNSKRYDKLKNNYSCCVLGNGPSLKDDLDNGRVRIEGNDIMCVNMFCLSPYFYQIKPRFYFLVDNGYFNPKGERVSKLVDELVVVMNQVHWEMFLVTSSSIPDDCRLLKSILNDNVKVLKLNSTTVEGLRNFRHLLYRNRLGMPRCQTVVNFALCAAINMGYENVYLYGADHTWTRDLFVDDDNVVCYGDRHVYNKNLTVIKKEDNFAHLLSQFAKMFEAHYELEVYSKSRGVKIWNCSSDTYLDAYERQK